MGPGPFVRRGLTIYNNGDAEFAGDVYGQNFIPTSSLQLKTNVQTLENALETVSRLRGASFNWKETGEPGVGLVAEEVAEVLPEVVSWKDGEDHASGVNSDSLVGVLVEATKAQQQEIIAQADQIRQLRVQNAELAAEVKAIREAIAQKS